MSPNMIKNRGDIHECIYAWISDLLQLKTDNQYETKCPTPCESLNARKLIPPNIAVETVTLPSRLSWCIDSHGGLQTLPPPHLQTPSFPHPLCSPCLRTPQFMLLTVAPTLHFTHKPRWHIPLADNTLMFCQLCRF